jgi:hypothetical protein
MTGPNRYSVMSMIPFSYEKQRAIRSVVLKMLFQRSNHDSLPRASSRQSNRMFERISSELVTAKNLVTSINNVK